jgi:phenylacetate-CoA ligase
VLRECPGIGEFQVVQERLDRLTVTVVPDGSFASADQERVARQLSRLFEDEISVEIVLTDAIGRPPSGKHRYVISKVADAHLGTPA